MRFGGFIFVFMLLCTDLWGQIQVSQQVLASGGTHSQTGSLSVSSTLGETSIFGGKTSNFFYCQGFQSGNESAITSIFETDWDRFHLQYFPNPTHDYLQLSWQVDHPIHQFNLQDEKGSRVDHHIVDRGSKECILDLRSLISGKYLLLFQESTGKMLAAGWIIFTR